jgi:hypothetical protein
MIFFTLFKSPKPPQKKHFQNETSKKRFVFRHTQKKFTSVVPFGHSSEARARWVVHNACKNTRVRALAQNSGTDESANESS